VTRLREFARALGVFFDLLAFAAFLGAVVGVFFFFAKTIANMAP
jgi:hypothetical protein